MIRYFFGNTNLSMEVRNRPEAINIHFKHWNTARRQRWPVNTWNIRQPAQNAKDTLQLAHADDVDCTSFKYVNEIEKLLAHVNLYVNTSRTEFTTV